MDFEPEATTPTTDTEFAKSSAVRKPLELLRDTEALLRRRTVETLAPILPPNVGNSLEEASSVAEESLNQLAEVDLDQIDDFELQPARILIGLTFVGFGALMMVLLLFYIYTLHPELSAVDQIREYWYQYIWFVCLGVAGMLMLGRESMR